MSEFNFSYFTIGQFAAIHGINKKTLVWYDEIGLFPPIHVGENGYRYYSYYQSYTLETILLLRELGVSIPNIQAFMENRSAETMELLLSKKISELDAQIAHLQYTRRSAESQRQSLRRLQALNLDEILLEEQPEKHLILIDNQETWEKGIDLVIEQAKRYHIPHLYAAQYGSMIKTERLYEGRFKDYSAMFIEIPQLEPQQGVYVRPAGTYLRAYCKGDWDRVPDRYKDILQYAREQGLELWGYSFETGINERAIDSLDNYITEINILVKNK